MKVAIIDYGAGNLPSVERALQGLGAETERATEARQVDMAKAIVLPGVGHFSAFVAGLRERNLTGALRDAYRAGVPILGICLGLQAMFGSSEEAPCRLLGRHHVSADPRQHRSISWGHQDATPYHQSSKFLPLQVSVL